MYCITFSSFYNYVLICVFCCNKFNNNEIFSSILLLYIQLLYTPFVHFFIIIIKYLYNIFPSIVLYAYYLKKIYFTIYLNKNNILLFDFCFFLESQIFVCLYSNIKQFLYINTAEINKFYLFEIKNFY